MAGKPNGARGPTPSSAAAVATMRANRRADTGLELAVRSALHRAGFRFRKDYPVRVESGVVRPDIVFPRQRLAVFCDGCFWHACPDHGAHPKANANYWGPKLLRNAERDRETDARLRAAGWSVLRIWEHVAVGEAVALVAEAHGAGVAD